MPKTQSVEIIKNKWAVRKHNNSPKNNIIFMKVGTKFKFTYCFTVYKPGLSGNLKGFTGWGVTPQTFDLPFPNNINFFKTILSLLHSAWKSR